MPRNTSTETTPTTPREAAYQAVLASLSDDAYVADTLSSWRSTTNPSAKDARLASYIANGTVRMAAALDYLALQATSRKKLSLKRKEKALLRCAVYQLQMMSGIASYAAVNESVELAKKYCHPSFAKFLNALLRKLVDTSPALPNGNDTPSLSLRYSYPISFIKMVRSQYGIDETRTILQAGNEPPTTFARIRPIGHDTELEPLFDPAERPFATVAKLNESAQLAAVAESAHYYIQNPTPAVLIGSLVQGVTTPPKRILDLCASPGGKTIALHDAFPEATIHANDGSKQRIGRLKENLEKYGLDIPVTCSPGEQFGTEEPFDLIVIDAPCSNSGTFGRRAEARWRYTPEQTEHLRKTQLTLLKHAASLLAPGGQIWYLTCSICPQENDQVVRDAADYKLTPVAKPLLITPSIDGDDGGFACALRKE